VLALFFGGGPLVVLLIQGALGVRPAQAGRGADFNLSVLIYSIVAWILASSWSASRS